MLVGKKCINIHVYIFSYHFFEIRDCVTELLLSSILGIWFKKERIWNQSLWVLSHLGVISFSLKGKQDCLLPLICRIILRTQCTVWERQVQFCCYCDHSNWALSDAVKRNPPLHNWKAFSWIEKYLPLPQVYFFFMPFQMWVRGRRAKRI